MVFQYDIRKRPSPAIIYLANPNHKIIRTLSGITKARLKPSLLDIWEIDFEVDKYLVSDTGKRFINPLYDKLSLLMELKIENLGWFRIDEMPEEHQSGDRTYKSFKAYGYETTLTDIDIVGININTGTEDSVEMYDENLDVLGIPKHNIQLYIKNESDDPTSDSYWKLGLLNILEHEYLRKKGWKIGDIDIAVAPLRGRQFEIDNQTVYSFLTQDAAVAYKCLFWFDRVNKTINATKLENLGSSMNLEFTFRNVINDIEIKDKNDKYYTRFRVAGNDSDSSLIEYINYGSDKLINIDYCIQTGKVSTEIAEKYAVYKEFVDSHREEYAEYSRTFMKLQEERTVYYEQVPIDEISVMYTNLSDEELQLELTTAETLRDTLLEVYGTEDAMKSSPDYQIYISYRDVIIPKIQAEIEARKSGTHASSDAIDYEHNWELYGINELNAKLEAYNIQIDFLKEKNYDKEWSSDLGGDQIYHDKQHQLYLDYVGYVNAITARLNDLQAKVDTIDELIKENNSSQQDLASQAQIEHYSWGFTASELSDIYALYRDTDYTDSTIEVLDTDTIDNIIELAWQLYDSAKEQIEIESHPQLIYSISLDNLFHIPQFYEKISNMSIGDFCYLELEDGFKTKQRLIGMELELVNFNDMDLSVEFSDMTTVCGKADDYRFLLESGTSSQKNSISRSTQNYIKNTASTVAEKVLANYFNSTGGSVFPTHISQSDIQKLQDALDGLIGGTLSLDELKVKLAQIDTLEADSAFVKYLETQYLVGNQADFKDLRAKVAMVDQLLSGTVSAELGHIIKLTADNVSISEAVIKDLIAAQITVSMLKAGDISTDTFHIVSDDGGIEIAGNTMQFKDANDVIRIQIGRDANNEFTFCLYDETGKGVLIDSTGIHESAIADGLIVNDMVADGTLEKNKFAFDVLEGDGNGNLDAGKVLVDGHGVDVEFTSIKNTITETNSRIDNLTSQIATIELMGEQIFKQIQGVVSPETITVTAVCRNGAMIGDWYIDDVLVTDTEYVSDDKMSITIPSSYMLDNNIVPIKVTDSTGELYDLHTLYLISDSTGAKGDDAYTVILQNENVSFSVDNSSNTVLSDQSYSSTVQIFQGTTERTDFTIGEINSANGITISVQDRTVILSVKNRDKITENNGFFTVPILIDDLTFYKDITWNLAKQGETGSSGEPSLNIVVGNESQNIPCSNEGLVLENFLIEIPFTGYKGFNRIDCSVSVGMLPDGVTLGSNTASTPDTEGLIILNVAKDATLGGASVLSGKVTLTFTIDSKNISRYFTWVKTKDGAEGSMILYELVSSSPVLNKNYDDTLSPPTITFNSYYRQSNSTNKTSYAGQFIIAESDNDGATYTNKYLSTAVEDFVEYTPSSASITSIRCTLCSADDVSIELDVLTIPVLTDVDSIKPIITEITTTMSGVQTQVDSVEKSITDKVWQTDISTSINEYDGSTVKSIRDRVASTETDISGIKTTLSDVQTTVSKKADGSTVQTLSTKFATMESNFNGFKTTVSNTYTTKDELGQSVSNITSQYTQLADKFNWIVKSGTSSSDFTITDRMISLTSSALNIDALTTFKNSAENGTSTVINGGAIKANTITTSKLATDAIKSTNYSYSSGNFSSAGTFLDLSTGLVRSKNFAIDSSGNAYFKGNIQANAGYIGGDTGWAITTNTITGNANSKIVSGILESSNYVENSTGVQVNLNTGIIKGNIEASTLAAKEAIKIYVGSTKRNVITGHLASDFFYVRIGCDLSTSNIARVQPSIILNKSSSSNMITINTSALDIEANTSIVGSLSASDISTYTNGGAWISGKTSAAINILTSQSEGAFHPVLRISSYSGNVWCLGGLGDTVGIYGYYSGRTANGYDWCTTWDTSNGNLTTTNNISCNDIMTRTGWAADRLSHGQTAYSNLMSGRISFNWAQNSSGLWKIYVYVDGALVRDW